MLRGGRVVDPAAGTDRIGDLVLDRGVVVGLGAPVPPGAEVLDARRAIVCPGWVDSHTHVFGDIGLDDPDTAGVLAGVTTLVDAGSSGSLTLDELLGRSARCRTDVYAIAYLDRRGIADTATIPTRVADIPAVPVGELRRAVDRHGDRIVAVKTGVYADLGLAWPRLALAVADLVGRPAYFHIGNFRTHRSADPALMAAFLDLLRPGDVVTHCYTAQPGGLCDRDGRVLPSALAAQARGVVFDVGHSGAGFDVEVARRLLDAGLRPATVSSDIAVINVRQRVRSLAHVLAKVWALGFALPDLLAMVTANPCRALGLPGGTFAPGAPADVTVVDVVPGPVTFDDGPERRYQGPGAFRVRATVKGGRVVAPDPGAVLDPANIRFHLLEPPAATRAGDGPGARLLERLAALLPDLPLDGEVVQAVVAHLAGRLGLAPERAGTVVRRAFADRASGNPPGWLLAEHAQRDGVDVVAARLVAAAARASAPPVALAEVGARP